jgi:hypothetical protein
LYFFFPYKILSVNKLQKNQKSPFDNKINQI